MLIGYFFVNYMNAIDQGKISFFLAILRHVILIIPILFLMNMLFELDGLVWAQLVADALNVIIATVIFFRVKKAI
jgi:Na+-driven multidrug efflux pump